MRQCSLRFSLFAFHQILLLLAGFPRFSPAYPAGSAIFPEVGIVVGAGTPELPILDKEQAQTEQEKSDQHQHHRYNEDRNHSFLF